MNWKTKISKIWRDQSGATAIEYGLIAALLALGIMSSLRFFAGATIDVWEFVASSAASAMGG